MTPKRHRIIYATDLCANSIDAFAYAINYAIEHEAKLIVFHVISKRAITLSKIFAAFFNEADEPTLKKQKANSAVNRMQSQLETICRKKFKDHPDHINTVQHLVIHYGKVAEEIVEKANRWGCDQIVLGPHKKGFLKRISPLSTSRKVVRLASKPVHFTS